MNQLMAKLDIKSVETLGTFENIVSASPKEIQDVALALRALIADVYPGVTEVPWGVQKNIGYGIGPRKQSEHFCYIFPHAHHVNLGFMQGAALPDPKSLLQGAGTRLRHVKVRSLAEAANPALRELVKIAAARLAQERHDGILQHRHDASARKHRRQ